MNSFTIDCMPICGIYWTATRRGLRIGYLIRLRFCWLLVKPISTAFKCLYRRVWMGWISWPKGVRRKMLSWSYCVVFWGWSRCWIKNLGLLDWFQEWFGSVNHWSSWSGCIKIIIRFTSSFLLCRKTLTKTIELWLWTWLQFFKKLDAKDNYRILKSKSRVKRFWTSKSFE